MELRKEEYSGDIHKKVYVSAEKGRKHIANNPAGQYEVRQYRLDGNIVKNMMCCDFLLLNDSCMNAYYIELKGSDIAHAVEQLEAGLHIFKEGLKNYTAFFRIVTSKTRTQDLKSTKFRRFQRTMGKERIIVKTNEIEETL